MKLVFMNGGLANQLFQYIFLRWLEIKTGEECIIEDSAFCVEDPIHNGYEIERLFGIKKSRLSQCFEADVWQAMMEARKSGKSIPQQLLDNGLQVSMIYESGNIDFSGNMVQIQPECMDLNVTGNWYFHGYWMSKGYFQEIEDLMRKELQFPTIVDEKNKLYEMQINQSNSIAIHVRRGDMVQLGRSMDANYFQGAIQLLEDKVFKAHYFVFSDDLAWCREQSKAMGLDSVANRVTFIEGNIGENAYIDLQLMSYCKHIITSWSSFSFLAGVLNENPDKLVISGSWCK